MCACVAQAGAARAVAIGVGDAACVDRGRLLALAARGVMEVERDLSTRSEMLQRLAEWTLVRPDETVWRRDAGALIKDVNEFRLLAWAGPDYIIRWALPEEIAPHAVGYNVLSDPKQAAAVKQ